MPLSPLRQADATAPPVQSLSIALGVAAVLTLLACLALAAGWRPGVLIGASVVLSAITAGLALVHIGRESAQRAASGRAMDGAAARFAGLLDSAMDAIVTVDEAQNIVLYNQAAERIFGWPTAQMLGQPLARLIPERYHADHGAHVRRFGSTGVSNRRMGGSSVVYGQRANGEEFQMDASISQLATSDGRLFTVILRDVSERLRSAQELERLSSRLAGLLDSAMDAIITVDEAQRIVLYNQAAEKIFGRPGKDMLGQTLDQLMPTRFRSGHDGHIRRFGTTGTTSRRMGDGTVLHGLRANGEEFPMEASISQLETADGRLFTVILRDVTERVRAQEELSAFAAEAHALREGEKTRIARELHDELAQSLTALKMDTIWLRDNLSVAPQPIAAKLGGMLSMLDTTVAATRRIAADLRPLLLDDLGLVPAIEWLVHNFTQRTGVACTLAADEELQLQEPYATAVFRIVQESLANVAKHAQATQVQVQVDRTPQAVMLRVSDNGLGFAVAAPRKPHSLGLMGLRERAQLLKGSIVIESTPGRGTRIEVQIPLTGSGATN
ncbi:MAG TPA: PAS domain-containing sensor histidine kinase [Burkholderiaceae bacterium]|nr:PAS domain-containing sensor histidine kinase [Burkholderiaceae bacterium]